MADVSLFGHKISPAMAVVFAGGSGIAIYFAYKQHKASTAAASTSSTSASAIDPITGLPYSEDSQIDPLTGQAYLAEAQQYGSVSAAESAVAGESSLAYSSASGYGYGTGYGLVGTSTDASLVPANEVQGTAYATNAAWAQAVEAGLTDIGYAPTDISGALGRYLGGLSETAAQATIVQAAIAEYGPPPVGSFQIIQAPSTTTTTGNVTVPSVVGMSAGDAHNAIVAAGLVPTAAAGQKATEIVTSTSPAGGTSVASGSKVTIITSGSSSSGLITVPDLAGQSAGQAHNALVALGLVPTAPPSQKANMKVWYTNPRAGSQVSRGTHVTIDTKGYV